MANGEGKGSGKGKYTVHQHIGDLVADIYDWYRGCVVCAETLNNLNRDLGGVMKMACTKAGVLPPPYTLRGRFTEDGLLVISSVPHTQN